jgi:kynurenine formamidase
MPLVDLSHPISTDMPGYPGTAPLSIVKTATLDDVGFEERNIIMSSHAGTHMDAPAHMIRDGQSLDRFPVDHFMGPAIVIELPAVSSLPIKVTDLEPHQNRIEAVEFVLLYTGWDRFWGRPDYFTRFPVLDMAAASWLGLFALKGLGIDTPSFDRDNSTNYPIHNLLLSRGIVLIENLTNLKRLQRVPFTLSCFPLPIKQADGSPVRAIAIVP